LNVGKFYYVAKQTQVQVHTEETRGAESEVTQKLHEETWNATSRDARTGVHYGGTSPCFL